MKNSKSLALKVGNYPQVYQKYLQEEQDLIEKLVPDKTVLEVGCGEGRIISVVAPLATSYTGIDINKEYLQEAHNVETAYKNVNITELNGENLSSRFPENSFQVVLCIWNTLGCVRSPQTVLEKLAYVTKEKCLLTVIAKGKLEIREQYYQQLGIDYSINPRTEAIYSPVWGISRAYSLPQIKRLCRKAGFDIEETGVLNDLAYYLILAKGGKTCKVSKAI